AGHVAVEEAEQPVDAARPEVREVILYLRLRTNRMTDDEADASSGGEHLHDGDEAKVDHELAGHEHADRIAAVACELAGGRVRAIVESTGGRQDPLDRLPGDAMPLSPAAQHRRNGGARELELLGDHRGRNSGANRHLVLLTGPTGEGA